MFARSDEGTRAHTRCARSHSCIRSSAVQRLHAAGLLVGASALDCYMCT